jgi:RND family efflux transporter MFP subunit
MGLHSLLRRTSCLGVVAVAAFAVSACSRQEAPPEPVRSVRTMTISPSVSGVTVEYAADVRSRVESRLGFRVGGKMIKRFVDLGDTVKAGQPLAQIDPQDLRLSQEAARAGLSSAQANYDQAQADFKRYRELYEQKFIGAAELERRETTLKAAKASLDQSRAQLSVQGNQAAYAVLVADAPGVITAVEAEPGQVLAAGTPVVRLAHDGARDAVFSVPEDHLQVVRALEGKAAAVKVKIWGSDAIVPATIREIAAATDPVTRTFLVKADVGRAPVTLGQTATAFIEMPKTQGVAKLPLSAVLEAEGKTSVWVLDPSTMSVRAQAVTVAGADGNSVVVASGLAPGQEVVTAGVHVLTPGQKVRRYVEDGAVAPAATAAQGGAAATARAATR